MPLISCHQPARKKKGKGKRDPQKAFCASAKVSRHQKEQKEKQKSVSLLPGGTP